MPILMPLVQSLLNWKYMEFNNFPHSIRDDQGHFQNVKL